MKKIFILFAVVLLVFCVLFLMFSPKRFKVQKEVVIHAPLGDVSPEIIDLNRWTHWYPDADKHLFSMLSGTVTSVLVVGDERDSLWLTAMSEGDSLTTRVIGASTVGLVDWLTNGTKSTLDTGLDSLKRYMEKN